jgi:hypothetical protein
MPEMDRGNYETGEAIFVSGSKATARKQIRKAIDQYFDRMEKHVAEEASLKRLGLRTRDGRGPRDRLRWVVMRLCKDMTFDEIAEDSATTNAKTLEAETVRKAVKSLMQRLDLPT